jgi:two-component system, LuxR family, response regulator FixJ
VENLLPGEVICMSASNEILIVDDDTSVCSLLSMAFSLAGYRVTTFGDGTSFVAAARMQSPACVLLDVYMPDKSGLDILKEIDARNYPAPILVLSGRGDIPTAVEAIKDGAYDFIEKWLDADGVVARVRETIDGWARQQQRNSDGGEPASQPFPGHDRLSPRERDVLGHIIAAASTKEVATILGISPRTVEVHRVHIMHKLGARNAADLVRIVLSNGRQACP